MDYFMNAIGLISFCGLVVLCIKGFRGEIEVVEVSVRYYDCITLKRAAEKKPVRLIQGKFGFGKLRKAA